VRQKRQTRLPPVTARRRVLVPAPLAREPREAVTPSRQVATTEPVETLALAHTPHALPALRHVPRQVEVVIQAVAAATQRPLRQQPICPKRHDCVHAPVGVQLRQQRVPVVQKVVDPARVPARPQAVPRVRVRLRRPIRRHPAFRVEVQSVALVRLRVAVPVMRIFLAWSRYCKHRARGRRSGMRGGEGDGAFMDNSPNEHKDVDKT
jgi:hypothetical protein